MAFRKTQNVTKIEKILWKEVFLQRDACSGRLFERWEPWERVVLFSPGCLKSHSSAPQTERHRLDLNGHKKEGPPDSPWGPMWSDE